MARQAVVCFVLFVCSLLVACSGADPATIEAPDAAAGADVAAQVVDSVAIDVVTDSAIDSAPDDVATATDSAIDDTAPAVDAPAAETCTKRDPAAVCVIPADRYPKPPTCGNVPDGCGGSMSCGTCDGICAKPWPDPSPLTAPGTASESRGCFCKDGYFPDRECYYAPGKKGRYVACFDDIEGLYAPSGNPDCLLVTKTPWRAYCCP